MEKRNWLFLRVGGDAGMVVLQEDKGDWPTQHFAFTALEADLERAAKLLRENGIEVEGPVTHDWMPAKSIYFDDPDGHALELAHQSQTLRPDDPRNNTEASWLCLKGLVSFTGLQPGVVLRRI